MTTEEIKEYIKEYIRNILKEEGDEFDDDIIQEYIQYSDTVYEGPIDKHHWYYTFFRVVKVANKYFGWRDAECTGDNDINDMWPFDWNNVKEVFPKEKTIIVYE